MSKFRAWITAAALGAASLFLANPASAQSACVYTSVYGAVLTVGQWNYCWGTKLDVLSSGSPNVAILQDQETQNTDGTHVTSATTTVVTLNTNVSDLSSIITAFSSNQFTLAAGTYLIEWS